MFRLDYTANGQEYSIVFSLPPIPKIAIVKDFRGKDLTLEFSKYFGPAYNFHGSILRPKDIGMGGLKILFEGEHREFAADDFLDLNKKLIETEVTES